MTKAAAIVKHINEVTREWEKNNKVSSLSELTDQQRAIVKNAMNLGLQAEWLELFSAVTGFDLKKYCKNKQYIRFPRFAAVVPLDSRTSGHNYMLGEVAVVVIDDASQPRAVGPSGMLGNNLLVTSREVRPATEKEIARLSQAQIDYLLSQVIFLPNAA